MPSFETLPENVRERGQAIILFVGIFSVILVIAAIVVDFGLWFAERRSAQRGADLAAAAGAQDLPLSPDLAFTSACAWAIKNGFDYTEVDVEVKVEVFARGEPEALVSCSGATPVPACGSQCDTIRVTVSKGAPRLFTGLDVFSIGEFDVGAEAVAGLTYGGGVGGVGPDQTIMLVDAQSRMRNACNGDQSNLDTCPIANERAAAAGLVDALLGIGGNGEIGYAPYHNCYGPAHPIGPPVGCVPDEGAEDIVMELPSDSAALHAAIAATVTYTQKPPNICVGLHKAAAIFADQPSNGHRVIVLFSDGSNRYKHESTQHAHPPDACHTTAVDNLDLRLPCAGIRSAESELDYLTLEMAKRLKDVVGVEIYVIALNPCPRAGDLSASPVDIPWQQEDCDSLVPDHVVPDDVADQRLLMCIATSPEHYQRVNNVAELPNVIEDIAAEIVSRSLLQ